MAEVDYSALLTGKTLSCLEFAREGRAVRGQLPIAGLPRLLDVVLEAAGHVRVGLAGSQDEARRPWLHLKVSGELVLVCQRCLGPLKHSLDIEADMRLIRPGEPWPEDELDEGDEAQADDAIEADEALLVQSLVEDEILLSLPYAPAHAVCELPGRQGANERSSPFAALKILKQH